MDKWEGTDAVLCCFGRAIGRASLTSARLRMLPFYNRIYLLSASTSKDMYWTISGSVREASYIW